MSDLLRSVKDLHSIALQVPPQAVVSAAVPTVSSVRGQLATVSRA